MNRLLLLFSALGLSGCIVVPNRTPAGWAPAPQPPPVYSEPPPAVQPPVYVPGPAEPPPPPPTVVVVTPPLSEYDIVIVYREVLDRSPSEREIWHWRERSGRQGISPDDLRGVLRASNEFRVEVPDRVIRRAFLDYHRVEPNPEELRLYRRRMIDEGWSIDRVRQDISRRTVEKTEPRADDRGDNRRDDRHGNRGGNRDGRDDDRPQAPRHGREGGDHDGRSFDAIINRAYSDVLERKPDPAGRAHYLRQLEEGASEEQIRAALRQSEEFRVTLPDAKTRRAYQEVLGREADEGGLQHYRKLIVDKGWTENDVKNDLRKSAEYRNRKR
jgi:hypothetical protein